MRKGWLLLLVSIALWANWSPRAQFEGRYGSFRQGAGLTLWSPLWSGQRSLIYGQATTGRWIDQWVGSVGIGYRKMNGSDLGLGLNLFGDVARADGVTRYQGGFGGEIFSCCWEGRMNFYFPTYKKRVSADQAILSQLTIVGLNVEGIDFVTDTFEQAYAGFDAEVGYSIAKILWGYAGYFSYWSDGQRAVSGPRLRGELRGQKWGVEFAIGGDWQWERIHKNQGSLYLRASLPFCCKKSRCICDRMAQPYLRERAPWVLRHQEQSTAFVDTGVQIIFAADGGVGPGTQLAPTTTTNANAISNPGDIIILLSDNGAITDGGVVLQDSQTLAGFLDESHLIFYIEDRPLVVENITNSNNAEIQVAGDGVTLASNTSVFGFNIDSGNVGILGTSVDNVSVKNINVNDTLTTSTAGVALATSSNVSMDTIVVGPGGGVGCDFDTNSGLIEIINSGSNGRDNTALNFNDGNAAYTFRNSIFETMVVPVAVSGGSNRVAFHGGQIDGSAQGMTFDLITGGFFDLDAVSINATASAMLTLNNNTSAFNLTMDGVTLTTNGQDAINTTTDASNVIIRNGTLLQEMSQLLNMTGSSTNIDLTGLKVVNANATAPPIEISGATGGSITIPEVIITDTAAVSAIDLSVSTVTLTVGTSGTIDGQANNVDGGLLAVTGGSPTVSFFGRANGSGTGSISIDSTSNATVILEADKGSAIQFTGTAGVSLTNNTDADFTFDGLFTDETTTTNFLATENTGAMTITNGAATNSGVLLNMYEISNSSGDLELLIEGCRTNGQELLFNVETTGTASMNVQFKNNLDQTPNAGGNLNPAFNFVNSGTGTFQLDALGNAITRTAGVSTGLGFDLSNGAGTFDVICQGYPSVKVALEELNNIPLNMPPVLTGTINCK